MNTLPILASSPSFWVEIIPLIIMLVGVFLFTMGLERLEKAIRLFLDDKTDLNINKLVFAIAVIISAVLVFILSIAWFVQSDLFQWISHTREQYMRLPPG
jgi:uncharacterized membrane protein